ncbi:MAG: hypothetical protein WCK02_11505 [Bacteroidota bacterium]
MKKITLTISFAIASLLLFSNNEFSDSIKLNTNFSPLIKNHEFSVKKDSSKTKNVIKNIRYFFGIYGGYEYASNCFQTKTTIGEFETAKYKGIKEYNLFTYEQNAFISLRTPIIGITKTWSSTLLLNKADYFKSTDIDIYGMITLPSIFKKLKPLKYLVIFGPNKYSYMDIKRGNYNLQIKKEFALMNILERERIYENFNNRSYTLNSDSIGIDRIYTRNIKINLDYGGVIEHFYNIEDHKGEIKNGKSPFLDVLKMLPCFSYTLIWSKMAIDYNDKALKKNNTITATGRGGGLGFGLNYWNYYFNNRLFVKVSIKHVIGDGIDYYFENTPPSFMTKDFTGYTADKGFYRNFNNTYFKFKLAFNI